MDDAPITRMASGRRPSRHPSWRDSVLNAFDAFRVRRDFSNDLELDPGFIDALADVFESGGDTITVAAKLMHRIIERDSVRVGRGHALSRPGFLPGVYSDSDKYRSASRAFAVDFGLTIMQIEDDDGSIAKDLIEWLDRQHSEGDLRFRLCNL